MKEQNKDRGQAAAWVLGVILSICLLVGVVWGGYLLGWWFNKDIQDRTSQVLQHSYGRQVAVHDAIVQEWADFKNPLIPDNQKQGITTEMCANYSQYTGKVPLPDNIITYLSSAC